MNQAITLIIIKRGFNSKFNRIVEFGAETSSHRHLTKKPAFFAGFWFI